MAFFQVKLTPPPSPTGLPPGASTTSTSSGGTNAATVINHFTVSSGLFDVTNSQYPITFTPGVVKRFYRYISPLVNLTDTFSGSFNIHNTDTATVFTLNATAQTLPQIAASITTGFGTYCRCYAVQLGTQGYLVLESPSTSTNQPNATSDSVLYVSNVALSDNADPYLNFQFVPFASNSLGIQSTSGYKWAVAVRDTVTGHISNTSPVSIIQLLNYPSEVDLTISATLTSTQVIEVYRTVEGGADLLFLGYASLQSGTTYTFRDTFGDGFLNPQLIGPISETNDPPPDGLRGLVAHQGRLWGIVDNRVYFSGGTETTNGSGNEAWPPGNYFEFPGSPVLLQPTESGLAVFLHDDVHLIRGVDAASFFPVRWLVGFGISNPNAVAYDGQTLYVYTSKQQLHALSSRAQEEIGFTIGDIFLASFPAATTSLTIHRGSSLDYALYVSNGTDTIMRFAPSGKSWSPKITSTLVTGRVKSLETSTGVNTLLVGGGSTVYKRDTSVWTDNGTPYSAFAVIGTLLVAEPGEVATIEHVAAHLKPVGTLPSIWVLNNEIDPAVVPFTQLNNPVVDPPALSGNPPKTLWAYRWYYKSSLTPLPQWINTIQIKIAFAAENAKNEVLGVYLRDRA